MCVNIKPIYKKKLMKKVAIVVSPNIALFELGCATDLFAINRDDLIDWYQTDVVSFFDSPLNVSGQADIKIEAKRVSNLDKYDMVVIPSWSFGQLELPESMKQSILDVVKKMAVLFHCVLEYLF